MDIPAGARRELREIEKRVLEVSESCGLRFEDVLAGLKEAHEARVEEAPASIFSTDALSALEAVVKYLKEETGLDYRRIAEKLGRNYAPIAITYRNARRKMPGRLPVKEEERIPLSIFRDKKLSVLESIAWFLKKEGKRYHEIASLLKRDDRTIWTVCDRARRKVGA